MTVRALLLAGVGVVLWTRFSDFGFFVRVSLVSGASLSGRRNASSSRSTDGRRLPAVGVETPHATPSRTGQQSKTGTKRTGPSSATTTSSSAVDKPKPRKKKLKKPKKAKKPFVKRPLWSEETPCPWCGAEAGERCEAPSGDPCSVHRARRLYASVLAGTPGAEDRLKAHLECLKKQATKAALRVTEAERGEP